MTDEKELKDQRVPIMMSASELEAVDEWMFASRIRSRGEAIRRLCQIGLAQKDRDELLDRCLAEIQKALPDLIIAARNGGASAEEVAPVLSGTVRAMLVLMNKAGSQQDLASVDINQIRGRLKFWDQNLSEFRKFFDLPSEEMVRAFGAAYGIKEGQPPSEETKARWTKFREAAKKK